MAADIGKMFREADEEGVRIALAEASVDAVRGDAVLFDAVQVPVVALAVMACIAGRRRGEPVDMLGSRVGHALTSAFPTFGRNGRYLQWSIRVRTVTAESLAFLETSGLIAITTNAHRKATLTERGRKFVNKVRNKGDDATRLYNTLAIAMDRTRHAELRLL